MSATIFLDMFALVMTASLVGTYMWASLVRDVYPILPYISDTGALGPERSLLSLGLSIGCPLGIVVVWTRFKQVDLALRMLGGDGSTTSKVNRYSFWLGCLSNFGMLLVAAFQENEVITVHILGAFLTFGGGCVYAVTQTYITYKLHRAECAAGGSNYRTENDERPLTPVPEVLARTGLRSNQLRYAHLRLLLVVVSGVAGLMMPPFAYEAFKDESNTTTPAYMNCTAQYLPAPEKPDADFNDRTLRWLPCYGGWAYHTASAVCEWMMALAFLGFFISFRGDFKRVRITNDLSIAGVKGEESVDCQYEDETPLLAATVN